jgi:2-desacetyl-2-hydroxyethyl bacteriochlorophyllide A dehydrogenase
LLDGCLHEIEQLPDQIKANVATTQNVKGNWVTGVMSAVAITAPKKTEIISVPIASPKEHNILVEVDTVGICGTDVHLYEGTSHYVQTGLTKFPIRFGHEWSGVVLACSSIEFEHLVGKRVTGEPFISCGQCLTCRGGHYNLCPSRFELGVRGDYPGAAAKYLSIPATNVHVIPDNVPLNEALLSEPAVTAMHAVERSGLQIAETAAVIGSGTLGLIVLQIARSLGAQISVIGVDEDTLKTAKKLGAAHVYRPEEAPSSNFDVVYEASGSSHIGSLLTRVAANCARIMQIGIPSGPVNNISFGDFVTKGLSLEGILGGVHLMPRTLELISKGIIQPKEMIHAVMPIVEISEAFELVSATGRGKPKILLDMKSL